MQVTEIQAISNEFAKAWEEFFGAEMFFVPLSPNQVLNVYDEVTEINYDFANKQRFFGQLRDNESLDTESAVGVDQKTDLNVTFVTMTLPTFNTQGIIQFTDQFNVTHYYKITDMTRRVMFNNYRIFTKAKLVELADYKTGSIV